MNANALTSAIPAELRERRQWVGWKTEQRDG
jgi:primase-polymerase (primpol)-like protein